MLRVQVVPEVLAQIVGDGISAAMLLTRDGALMGAASADDSKSEPVCDAKVVGAIATHTWAELARAGNDCNPGHELESVIVDLENGRLALAPAGASFLLCAYSTRETPVGFLKAKVEALRGFLAPSLEQIQA